MLSAARAALSERDEHARTHRGSWALFREAFVVDGPIDEEVYAEGPRTQAFRWAADYEGEEFSAAAAQDVLDAAERFVTSVEAVLRES